MRNNAWLPGLVGAGALAAAFLVTAVHPTFAAATTSSGTLTVTGQSTLSIAPTEAQLSLGTQLNAGSAAGAMSEDATRVAAVVAALEKAGVPAKDIQTQNYDLNPNETQNNAGVSKVDGYQISDQLQVTTTDLGQVGALIDDAVTAGANVVNGVTFTVPNSTAILDEANNTALAQAHSQAQSLAAAAGEKLGRLVSLTVDQAPSGPLPFAAAALSAARAPVIVAPSSLQVSAQVTAVYQLLS